MAKGLKIVFLIHTVVAAIIGLPLLLIPGRFLGLFGWAPVEPIINRIFGAALLALAWSSFRGWRAKHWSQVAILVEADVVFTVLSCVGLLRHLLKANYTLIVWGPFALLLIFAIAWIVALLQHTLGNRAGTEV